VPSAGPNESHQSIDHRVQRASNGDPVDEFSEVLSVRGTQELRRPLARVLPIRIHGHHHVCHPVESVQRSILPRSKFLNRRH
jgi:hypothetical protein